MTVTNFSIPTSQKRVIWLIAGQHPCESVGRRIPFCLLKYLASDAGAYYRNKYVFKIIPQMNPDGVYDGFTRTNSRSVNLNRNWDAKTKQLEVAAAQKAITTWINNNPIDLFIDFHGDQGTKGYVHAQSSSCSTPEYYSLSHNLALNISYYTNYYSTRILEDTPSKGTARGYMFFTYGVLTLTLEAGENPTSVNGLCNTAEKLMYAIDNFYSKANPVTIQPPEPQQPQPPQQGNPIFIKVSCDNTTNFYFSGLFSLDQDRIEGNYSIAVNSNSPSISYLKARYLVPFALRNLTAFQTMSCWLKTSDRGVDIFILAPDWNNRLYYRLKPSDNWIQYAWKISDMTKIGNPNLSNVREIQLWQYCYSINRWFKVDDIRLECA